MPIAERQGTGTQSVREKLVETAKNAWIDRLIDTSRRNNLLFFRPVLGGSIEIPESNSNLFALLNGETVQAASLLPNLQDRPGRILSIARKARENQEEKGLQTLYLALGFAIWKAEDGGRDYRAPVFMIPLHFKLKGTEHNSVDVSVAGDPQINPVLLHILFQRFGVQLDNEGLLPEIPEEGVSSRNEGAEHSCAILDLYKEKLAVLSSQVRDVPEFRADVAAIIGNFAFAKMAMVNDLKEAGSALPDNALIASIAGDMDARGAMTSSQVDVDPHTLDEHSPDDEFCVVESDSSQQCAIDGIAMGQSAVVHGPPGTGKSQTITNLIATIVGRGKTVLFVAEKRAALEVVQQRLHRSQLGHLAIDLHGAELSSKKVMERVSETLNTVRHSKLPDCEALHRQFVERRSRLNQHDKRMHTLSPQTGMSLFDMRGRLLSLPGECASEVRWRGAELQKLNPTTRSEVRDLLGEARGLAGLLTRTDPSPWTGIAIRDGSAAQNAIDTARRLAFESLPALRTCLSDVHFALGFEEPRTFAMAIELATFLRDVDGQVDLYSEEVYAAELSPILVQLEKAASPLKAFWLALTSSEYKANFKQAVALRKGVKVSASRLLNELRGSSLTPRGGASKPAVRARRSGIRPSENLSSKRIARGN